MFAREVRAPADLVFGTQTEQAPTSQVPRIHDSCHIWTAFYTKLTSELLSFDITSVCRR